MLTSLEKMVDTYKNTVHRKMTFHIVYPHLDGFLPTTYRFSKIYTYHTDALKFYLTG